MLALSQTEFPLLETGLTTVPTSRGCAKSQWFKRIEHLEVELTHSP